MEEIKLGPTIDNLSKKNEDDSEFTDGTT